jgi:autotransporter-associated beta strand protein
MLAVAVVGVTSLSVYATDGTKADNNTSLDQAASWVSSIAPDASGNAIFNSTVTAANVGAMSIAANVSWGGMQFTTLTGTAGINTGVNVVTLGTLGIDMTAATQNVTLANSGTLSIGSSQSWSLATGRTLTIGTSLNTGVIGIGSNTLTITGAGSTVINSTIGTSGTLVKSGAGNLSILSTNSTFTGNIVLNAGTLTSTANPGTGIVTLAGGTWSNSFGSDMSNVFNIIGNATFSQTNGSPTLVNAWTGSGTLSYTGSARIILGGTANQLDGFTGRIMLNQTINAFTTTPSKPAFGLNFGGNRTANYVYGNPLLAIDLGTDSVYAQQGGTITIGSVSGNPGSILVGANSANTVATNNSTSQPGSLFIIGSASTNNLFNGAVLDGGSGTTNGMLSLTKVGSGTLTLGGTGSTYSGALTVSQGTVEMDTTSAFGTATTSSSLVLGDLANSGTARYLGGSLTSGRALVVNAGGTVESSGSGPLILSNTAAVVYNASAVSGTAINLIGTNAGSNTLAAAIGDNGAFATSLNKSGAGTWMLTSTGNSLTGTTTISGGKLYVASGLGSKFVNVTAGTFGANGALGGSLTVAAAAHLAPGFPGVNSGVGTMTLGGDMAMANSSALDLDFLPGANDLIDLAGHNLNLGTSITVTALQAGTPNAFASLGTYNIFTNIGSITGSASNLNVVGGDPVSKYQFVQIGGNIILSISQLGAVWTGLSSGNNWSDPLNWVGQTLPATTDAAVFNIIAAQSSINLDSNQTVGIVSLDNGTHSAFTIASNNSSKLFLDSGTNSASASILNKSGNNAINTAIQLSVNTNISMATNTTLTLGGNISSGASATGLSIGGPGTVILTGNNSYTGDTTIAAGTTLQIGAGASGNLPATTANLINNGAVIFDDSTPLTITNTLAGTGNWSQIGSGITTLNPANAYTATNSLTVSSGVLHGGSVIWAGPVSLTGGVLTGDTGSMTNTVSVSGGTLTYGSGGQGGSLSLTGGKVDLVGNTVTVKSLSGNTGTSLTNSGAASTLVLSTVNTNPGTTFSGVLSGNLSLMLKNDQAALPGSTLTLDQVNSYTGKTIIGNSTQAAGGLIVVANNQALSSGEVDIVGAVGSQPVVLEDGINLPNNIVTNVNTGAGELFSVRQGTLTTGSATLSGNISVTNGSGSNGQDIGNSSLRLGPSAAASTLTLTGKISSVGTVNSPGAGTNSLLSTVIILGDGTVNLVNATVNSGTSEVAIGRNSNNTNVVSLTGNSTITNTVASGLEGFSMGGGANQTVTQLTLTDNSVVDIGASNFNINAIRNFTSSGVPQVSLLANSKLKVGGFTKSNTNSNFQATLIIDGGTIVAERDNPAFMPLSVNGTNNTLLNVTVAVGNNGANIDLNGHAIEIDENFIALGSGGLSVLSPGTLTLTGTNSYSGTTNIASGTVILSGTVSAISAANVINNGVLAVNRPDVFTLPNNMSGTGGVGNLGPGTTTLTGSVTLSGPAPLAAGQLTFSSTGSPQTDTMGAMSGAGVLAVDTGVTLNIVSNAGTSKVGGLSLTGGTGAWTSRLEISNNALVVEPAANKASVLASLQDQVAHTVGGTVGITSSSVASDPTHKVLVVVDNALLGLTTFNGVPVDSSSVLVEATYFGDSNLDRKVDVTDLGTLATNYGKSVPNGILQGDFNGDGKVDVTDLGLLATDYGLGTSGGPFTLSTAAVPEPASLAALALGSAALMIRRRRR